MELAKYAPLFEGAPLALWINLARSPERRAKMQAELDALGVRHARVEAIDGADMDGYAARHGVRVLCDARESPGINGCVASHVLAMIKFLREHPDEERVMVLEDDCSFEYVPYWRKSLRAYLDATAAAAAVGPDAPPGIVQLAVMLADPRDVGMISPDRAVPRPRPNWFSTAAYVIDRAAATAITSYFSSPSDSCGGGVVIDLRHAPTVHADIILYVLAPTWTVPLLTYTCDMSYIHPEHVPSHVRHRETLARWWQQQQQQLAT